MYPRMKVALGLPSHEQKAEAMTSGQRDVICAYESRVDPQTGATTSVRVDQHSGQSDCQCEACSSRARFSRALTKALVGYRPWEKR